MSIFENKAVKTVREALAAAGSTAEVTKLQKAAKSPADVAQALDVPVGSIVTAAVYLVGEQPVLALVAGDRECRPASLGRALNLEGEARAATAPEVKAATGFAVSGVAPVGAKTALPTVIDVSLKRFDALHAPAGEAQHVFATSMAELKTLTGGIVSYAITEGEPPRRPLL